MLSVIASLQWDPQRDVALQRKPAKFHFINLSVALAFSPNRMTTVDDFKRLPPEERSKWLEWLVAQEILRRQCIAGIEDPATLWFWASKDHEVDFVDARKQMYEVKVGRSGPLDFGWFPRAFPRRRLLVIGGGEFRSSSVKGITLEQFLLATACRIPTPARSAIRTSTTSASRFSA